MKKMKYYEETSALLHEFSEENQKYFEELWDSFNLAGFLYDEDYLREQIYFDDVRFLRSRTRRNECRGLSR